MEDRKTESTVDIAKFFFCVCIIALHTTLFDFLPGSLNYYVEKIVLRLAVPYFFVCSGYFFGKKASKACTADALRLLVRNYIMRLLVPFLFFLAINCIQQMITLLSQDTQPLVALKSVVQHIFFYPYGALWYVQASMVGILLLYPFVRFKKMGLALVLGVFLFAFALLCNNYYSFCNISTHLKAFVDGYLAIFLSARNGVFVAFLYLAIGIKLSFWLSKGSAIPSKTNILLLLVGFGTILIAEVWVVLRLGQHADDGSLYISHLLFVPLLFLATLTIKSSITAKMSMTLRNCSTGMYYLHRPVLWCLMLLPINSGVIRFGIVSVLCLCICLLAYRFNQSKVARLLK